MLHKTPFYLNACLKLFLFTVLLPFMGHAEVPKPNIIQKPIHFGETRITLTKEYIKNHYGITTDNIKITPKMIVVHFTAINHFGGSYRAFEKETITISGRDDIKKASKLNVSAHFLVDKDGTIYQLMPDNWMGRHCIGLNYVSLAIENVGGGNYAQNLTQAQLNSNTALVRYLQEKYPSIEHIIGHHEYLEFQNTSLWMEKDPNYRTIKADPGKKFMAELRSEIKNLALRDR